MRAGRVALLVAVAMLGSAGTARPDQAPVYRLRLEVDLLVVVIEGTVAFGWLLENELAPPFCAPVCDQSRVNALDRPFAGRWSPDWSTAGSAVTALALVAPLALLPFAERPGAALSDLVVVI